MNDDAALNHPELRDLAIELSTISSRYVQRLSELTGVHLPTDAITAMAIDTAIATSKQASSPDGTLSLTARRLAQGKPALAAPGQEIVVDKLVITLEGTTRYAEISQRLYGDASEANVQKVVRAALERGLVSIRRELAAERDG